MRPGSDRTQETVHTGNVSQCKHVVFVAFMDEL